MNLEDFKNVSEATKKRNPHLYGGRVGADETPKPQLKPLPALDKIQPDGEADAQGLGVRVVFILNTRNRWDYDNLVFALKGARDAVAKTIGLDDNDPRIEWRYHQIQDRHQGLMVKITPIQQMN